VRLAGRKAPTVQALRDRYMREHAHPNKKPVSVENDERNWRLYILPKLGHRRVADLSRDDIEGFRPQLADRPATFNAVRRLLSCALNLAEVWGWRPEGSNPCRHVKRLKVVSRDRHLSQGELGRLADALAAAERTAFINPRAVTAIRLLLLTGCRCGEIRKLRWEDVDFDGKCLRLPDSKTGAKVVYLNSPALEVLAGIERDAENPHVLPGGKPGQPIADLKTPWLKLRRSIGLEDVRLHDLRHTFASFGVGMGLSLQMVGKLLGHSHITTTQIYAHLDDDPVRQAGERIGEEIAAMMLGRPKAEVVALAAGP
jgi:integrase